MLKEDYSGKIIMSSSLAKSELFLETMANQVHRVFKSKTRVYSQITTSIPTCYNEKDFSGTQL
jgi:hypothetical protein